MVALVPYRTAVGRANPLFVLVQVAKCPAARLPRRRHLFCLSTRGVPVPRTSNTRGLRCVYSFLYGTRTRRYE
eukprot:scaffold4555_cov17-Prasinocladus_malaysianus.AAC.1